jgi:flavin reductase (DIM6/NTAB) family NADH-FMN oxidoreductase RutF
MTATPSEYRHVLGHYPTGVIVVTAFDAGGNAQGMTLGTFSSVSLDPQLVSFLPSVTSSSWAALEATGNRFCINILGVDQVSVCRAVATRKTDKFADVELAVSVGGNPAVVGSIAHIDCVVQEKHAAGDHVIVVAAVEEIELVHARPPLVFLRGGYGSFVADEGNVPLSAFRSADAIGSLLHLPTWADWELEVHNA